jgi:hypothetical protein
MSHYVGGGRFLGEANRRRQPASLVLSEANR